MTSTAEELSCKRQKMNGAESCVNSASKRSEVADLKQFDKLFVELLAESTASEDPKLVDAMKWFKRASTCCQELIMLDLSFVYHITQSKLKQAFWLCISSGVPPAPVCVVIIALDMLKAVVKCIPFSYRILYCRYAANICTYYY